MLVTGRITFQSDGCSGLTLVLAQVFILLWRRQLRKIPGSGGVSSSIREIKLTSSPCAVGDAVQFPGKDPLTVQSLACQVLDVHTTTATTLLEAAQRKKQIQQLWAGRWNRRGYNPQLGWNPETGEPWMAVRSYAENSYPALSGEQHSHLKHVQEQMPEFVLQYERFPHLGFTLIVSLTSSTI